MRVGGSGYKQVLHRLEFSEVERLSSSVSHFYQDENFLVVKKHKKKTKEKLRNVPNVRTARWEKVLNVSRFVSSALLLRLQGSGQ